MEIKIGIQHSARELIIESSEDAKTLEKSIAAAFKGEMLSLTDHKGKKMFIPSAAITYIEIGVEEQRRVGFGAL